MGTQMVTQIDNRQTVRQSNSQTNRQTGRRVSLPPTPFFLLQRKSVHSTFNVAATYVSYFVAVAMSTAV